MVVVVDTISAQPLRPRHPEKVNRPDSLSPPKPDWIRVRAPNTRGYADTRNIVKENGLVTVCEEAGCPNIGECWDKKHATFMIMGDTCTRACAFCNVKTGIAQPHSIRIEPVHVGEATFEARASPISSITSVDRDDLADGGAGHIRADHPRNPGALPRHHHRSADAGFPPQGRRGRTSWSRRGPMCSTTISKPCRRVYLTVRPGARYFAFAPAACSASRSSIATMFTKSGIMVGLGEERNEVLQVMDDLRSAGVDFLTIGQYLQPTRKHHAVMRYVTPDEFAGYEKVAYTKGFLMVSASPLTRSSHHAGDDFAKLKAARAAISR